MLKSCERTNWKCFLNILYAGARVDKIAVGDLKLDKQSFMRHIKNLLCVSPCQVFRNPTELD